jgi:hypothetical protein
VVGVRRVGVEAHARAGQADGVRGYRVTGGIVFRLVVVEGELFVADQGDGARIVDGVHP